MSQFLTALDQVLLDEDGGDGRAIWVLDKPLLYQSDLVGIIEVPSGFRHDSASVPRLPVAWWLTGDTAHAAAVIHDFLYAQRGVITESKRIDRRTAKTMCFWRRCAAAKSPGLAGAGDVAGCLAVWRAGMAIAWWRLGASWVHSGALFGPFCLQAPLTIQ